MAGPDRRSLDVKYKAEKPSGFPQADLYQLFACCTVLGLPVGHLVYAKGNEDARQHVVRDSGVRIVAHTLDVEAKPEALLESVRALAGEMLRRVTSMANGAALRLNRLNAVSS